MKTKQLLTAFIIILVVLIAGCKKDDFVEVVGVCPEVVSTDPENAAVNVPLNKIISATFNVEMNPATINNSTFILEVVTPKKSGQVNSLKSATDIQGATPLSGTVSYSGTTATFIPTSALLNNTTYTCRLTTVIKEINGNPLQVNYVWSFSTGATLIPTVISSDPSNDATGVELNKIITATFSVPMNPSTINSTTFTLKQGTTSIAGVVSYTGTTASFIPTSVLESNTIYTATITTGAMNTTGTAMVNNYIWTFTTGAIVAPTVISTIPLNNAIDVALNSKLSAKFSEPMNPLTLTATTFVVKQGAIVIDGTISYVDSTVTFTPTINLLSGTVYTVKITTGAKNVAGTPLASDYVWTFTSIVVPAPTIILTDPLNLAIDVALNKVITAKFSTGMDPLTISGSTFTVNDGILSILGVVSYADSVATFTPSANLLAGVVYTATITNVAANLLGINLANDYIWTFTTGAIVAPTVISTIPANLATGVPLNQLISATFSEAMDPLTIKGSSFTLLDGIIPITGAVSYSGTTAIFTPASNLTSGKTYTAIITKTAMNLAGVALVNDYTWTFTALVIPPPTVLSTNPLNLANDVALNKIIGATFSTEMDPLTITSTTFTIKDGATPVTGTISYSGTTASFTPTALLLAGKTYTATITKAATSVAGFAMTNDYVWTFSTPAAIVPTVTLTDPLDLASGVALNKIIGATFNTEMDPLTITSTTFTIKDGATPVTGTISYSGTTASFTPTAPLVAGKTYTATIKKAATSLAGIAMTNDYVWTFSTPAAIVPTVTLTDPLDLASGVALNKVISATFSEAMNPLTITASSFTLKDGATSISGVVNYSGSTATFTPNVNLSSGKTYTATITTVAANPSGTTIAVAKVWTFTTVVAVAPTVTSTSPINGASGVALNKQITATFSEPMNSSTITSTSFKLSIGATPVSGSVSYSGSTATFAPSDDLLSDNTYTATITILAKSATGVALVSNYVWTFSTVGHLGPIAPTLSTVERFGIIAGVGVTNAAGASEIHDLDVGIYPGARSSITGFFDVDGGPGLIFNGEFYAADDVAPPGVNAMLNEAKLDLVAAYLFAEGATSPAPTTIAGDQGGKTLAPGIYKSTSTLLIQSGDLTLDAQGDANAVWIFQIASDFTTIGGSPYPSPAGGNVILSGGAQAKNVYWQVGSSAVIGDYTSFKGNILALTSITMNAYSQAVGRMLTQNAAVTLTSTNRIYKP